MPDVGPAVGTAGRAHAALFDGAGIQLIFLVEQVQLSLVCVHMAVASVSGGVDTIEEHRYAEYKAHKLEGMAAK